MHHKVIRYPYNREDALDAFIEKRKDRRLKTILYIPVNEMPIKDLLSLMLLDGFDGIFLTNVATIHDITYTRNIYKYLRLLPKPYTRVHWCVYISVNTCSVLTKDYILVMVPSITGIVLDHIYEEFNPESDLNNIEYHSSELKDLVDQYDIESVIDLYLGD